MDGLVPFVQVLALRRPVAPELLRVMQRVFGRRWRAAALRARRTK